MKGRVLCFTRDMRRKAEPGTCPFLAGSRNFKDNRKSRSKTWCAVVVSKTELERLKCFQGFLGGFLSVIDLHNSSQNPEARPSPMLLIFLPREVFLCPASDGHRNQAQGFSE